MSNPGFRCCTFLVIGSLSTPYRGSLNDDLWYSYYFCNPFTLERNLSIFGCVCSMAKYRMLKMEKNADKQIVLDTQNN